MDFEFYKEIYFMISFKSWQMISCTCSYSFQPFYCTELSCLAMLKAMVHITEELAVFDPSEQ